MSEWLTTGEMIDRLGSKEVAKNKGGDKVYWSDDMKLIIESTNGNKYDWIMFDVKFMKWHILPNYVSFEEAMKALKAGKDVTFHLEDGGCTTFCEADKVQNLASEVVGLTFSELCFGIWTIEEEI